VTLQLGGLRLSEFVVPNKSRAWTLHFFLYGRCLAVEGLRMAQSVVQFSLLVVICRPQVQGVVNFGCDVGFESAPVCFTPLDLLSLGVYFPLSLRFPLIVTLGNGAAASDPLSYEILPLQMRLHILLRVVILIVRQSNEVTQGSLVLRDLRAMILNLLVIGLV
jgi:hypothetical protein